MIGDLVARLIAAGVPADVAAMVVTEAFAAGAAATIPRNSAEIRTEKRKERDRLRKQLLRGIPRNSAENDGIPRNEENPPISTSKISKESKRQNRGTRIAVDWAPTDAERSFAKQEGFSDWEIQREAQKFRDYWTACAGSKGVKLDWSATWRQWIRSGAERAGKAPAPSGNDRSSGPAGFYAAADSEQLAAWDAYNQQITGKTLARDRNGGWRVKSEWPPDYVPIAKREQDPPMFRGMQ
jgi:hypothetical protein